MLERFVQAFRRRGKGRVRREDEHALCFGLRCLFKLLSRLARFDVCFFGTAQTSEGMRSWSVCQTERPSAGVACSSWTGSGPAADDDEAKEDELATADERSAGIESEGRKAPSESRTG